MRQIRNNVFETNSSSTHSICVAKTSDLEIPEKITFSFGEFGWEYGKLSNIDEKASYLYTGLIANGRDDDMEKIVNILSNAGIEVICEDPSHDNGYIDHCGELYSFLNGMVNHQQQLYQFLFSPLSYILTGNDNGDYDIEIDESYDYCEYYKGN